MQRSASFVAPPSAVIVKPGACRQAYVVAGRPVAESGSPATGRPTPVIGAGFVMPVSSVPARRVPRQGRVVSADGRTVLLVPAAFSDAFDYYKLNLDLGQGQKTGPRRPVGRRTEWRARAAGESTSVLVQAGDGPGGRFDAEVMKGWFVPVGAKFDLSVQLEIG